MSEDQEYTSRRGVLKASAAVGAASLAGCGGGGSDSEPEYGGQIEPDGEYEEISIPEIRSGELNHMIMFYSKHRRATRAEVTWTLDMTIQ